MLVICFFQMNRNLEFPCLQAGNGLSEIERGRKARPKKSFWDPRVVALNNSRLTQTKFKMILCLIGSSASQMPVGFRKLVRDVLIIAVICLMTNLSSLESFLRETVRRSNVAQDIRWIYHRLTLACLTVPNNFVLLLNCPIAEPGRSIFRAIEKADMWCDFSGLGSSTG
jgi:hypothetical protein